MNTFFTRMVPAALLLATLSLAGCKKDEVQVVATNAGAPTLAASNVAPNLGLTQTNASSTASTFTYTAANFGYQGVVTYTLQFDKKGGNFTAPASFDGGTTAGKIDLNTAQLVSVFNKLGLSFGVTSQIDARVIASVGAGTQQASQVLTLTGTPTPLCIPNTTGRTWSLIGPAGTDWNTDIPLTYDCATQTFRVTRALNAGEFKFRANNDWTVNFGTASATSSITMAGLAQGVTLVNNNNNLQITTAGTYTIVLEPNPAGTSGTVTVKP